jgi:uncharacterized protein
VSETVERIPAVEGWFTVPEPGSGVAPRLIGVRCADCRTYVFPPRDGTCPNPACDGEQLVPTELSNRGRLWSFTENRYAPPPPYKAADPFEPYALAAVELEAEGLIVLGQVPKGVLAADLRVGMDMELEISTLDHDDDGTERLIYMWAPAAPRAKESD